MKDYIIKYNMYDRRLEDIAIDTNYAVSSAEGGKLDWIQTSLPQHGRRDRHVLAYCKLATANKV